MWQGAVRSAPTATRRAACAGGMLGSRLCTCPSPHHSLQFRAAVAGPSMGACGGSVAGYGPQNGQVRGRLPLRLRLLLQFPIQIGTSPFCPPSPASCRSPQWPLAIAALLLCSAAVAAQHASGSDAALTMADAAQEGVQAADADDTRRRPAVGREEGRRQRRQRAVPAVGHLRGP